MLFRSTTIELVLDFVDGPVQNHEIMNHGDGRGGNFGPIEPRVWIARIVEPEETKWKVNVSKSNDDREYDHESNVQRDAAIVHEHNQGIDDTAIEIFNGIIGPGHENREARHTHLSQYGFIEDFTSTERVGLSPNQLMEFFMSTHVVFGRVDTIGQPSTHTQPIRDRLSNQRISRRNLASRGSLAQRA